MRYKVKKGSSLARVLTDEQKELRYEIIEKRKTSSGKTTFYVISALMNDGSVCRENALPDEIYPVDLNFSERILEGIKEEVNNFIKK